MQWVLFIVLFVGVFEGEGHKADRGLALPKQCSLTKPSSLSVFTSSCPGFSKCGLGESNSY